jgi:hypothetical protein
LDTFIPLRDGPQRAAAGADLCQAKHLFMHWCKA